jgi:hypothetical protein
MGRRAPGDASIVIARVVEGAFSRTNASPGIARQTSSSVAPQWRCHGPTTSRYVPITPEAIRRPTTQPFAAPIQAINPASTPRLATMHPRTISPMICFVRMMGTSWMQP